MTDKILKSLSFLLTCLSACGGEGTTTGSGGVGGTGGTGGESTTTATPDPIPAVLNTYEDEDSLDIHFGPYLGEEGPVTGNVYEEDGDWAGFIVYSPGGGMFITDTLRLPFYQGGQACVLLDTKARIKAVTSVADLGDPNDATQWDQSFDVLVAEMKADAKQDTRWNWEKQATAMFESGLAVIFQVHADSNDPNGVKRNCPIAYATNDTETPDDLWGHFQMMCGAEPCGWNPLHLSPVQADAQPAHWAGDVIGSYIPLMPAPPPAKAKPKVIPLVQRGVRMRRGLEMYLN